MLSVRLAELKSQLLDKWLPLPAKYQNHEWKNYSICLWCCPMTQQIWICTGHHQTCGVGVGCCKGTLPRTRMPTSGIYSEYIRKAAVQSMRDLFILFLLVERLGRRSVGSPKINITQVDLNQVAQDQLGHLRPTSPKLILIASFSAATYEPPDQVLHGFPWVGEHHYRGQ